MTREIRRTVQRDVTDQMELIQEMAQVVEAMFEEARASGDRALLERAQIMAAKLDALSKKAYEVGAAVLVNAA